MSEGTPEPVLFRASARRKHKRSFQRRMTAADPPSRRTKIICFEVNRWTGSTPPDVRQSSDAVVAAVNKALDEAGIEIPFPYRTLTFGCAVPGNLSNTDG